MANRWGIPEWLEDEVRSRDTECIYCGITMDERISNGGSRKTVATWEHIINDEKIITRENIARCCAACNASKGTKSLLEWFQSNYCKVNGISEDTVADVVKEALKAARKTRAQRR